MTASNLAQGIKEMLNQKILRKAGRVSVLGLIGLGLAVAEVQASFAGSCLGHCQAMKMCGDLVSRKGVKALRKEMNIKSA
jgi:hypothetical protein